jgi:hypothetical protein
MTFDKVRLLERDANAQLNLAAWSGRFGDRPKLRRVHEAIGYAEIDVIERVEEFGPELQLHFFGQAELALQGEIEALHSGAINRIAPQVAEGKCRWRGEGRRVEPTVGTASARTEDRLAGVIGADWILTQQRAGIGGVAEDRNREWEPALNLIDQ